MTIALDLGGHALRSLRRRGDGLVARRCRSIAACVADNEARRRWLAASKIPHLVAEECLVIPGDAAIEAEGLCEALPIDLLPNAELPAGDPVTRQVLAALVDGLLPRPMSRGVVCCFTQPGYHESLVADPESGDQRLEFFTRLIHLRGYRALPVNPATALVLAELGSHGFTGIGISPGASGCELAVVHRGQQLTCARLARGGRWIDEQIARRQELVRRDSAEEIVLDLDGARAQKEDTSFMSSMSPKALAVGEICRQNIAEIAEALAGMLASDPRLALLPQPLPVVCCGGPTQIAGFAEQLERELDRCNPAVDLEAPWVVPDSEFTIARGCLIRATVEESVASHAAQSAANPLFRQQPAATGV
ncbi:MAG: hypothetical protein HY290_33095 [Planctomycetia bacterium]|nr:hypothetical protein [Planctomycetia bacterium]